MNLISLMTHLSSSSLTCPLSIRPGPSWTPWNRSSPKPAIRLLPKLIIQVDQASPAEEQDADSISEWPYVAPETEMPSLYVKPEEQDLTIDESSEQDDEVRDISEKELALPTGEALDAELRAVLQALRTGACIDLDCSRLGVIRAQCQVQVGRNLSGGRRHRRLEMSAGLSGSREPDRPQGRPAGTERPGHSLDRLTQRQ